MVRVNNRFKANVYGQSTYNCGSCGKRTRETGEGESDLQLCRNCFDEAGYENEHLDYGDHYAGADAPREAYNERCPICRNKES